MAGKGIQSGKRRASGETAASEEAKEEIEKVFDAPTVEMPEEVRRTHRTPGFTRMRLDWASHDKEIVRQAISAVEGRILANFSDAYQLMYEVYEVVRTAELNTDGSPKRDGFGFAVWKKTPSGAYEEDWSRLGVREKERFLFTITTGIFEWEQRAANAWTEAMFAKAIWEERFANGFTEPTGRLTVDDRTNRARVASMEERYFAIFQSLLSRKADAVVSGMELIGQRLKDMLT